MTAKKLMILVLAMALLIAIPSVLFADGGGEAEAELTPQNNSGIEAEIEFEDDGTTLTVTGEAEGMTPGVVYRSLVYDIASSPSTCLPAIFDGPNNIIPTMLLGFWDVDEDGEGTLSATNTNNGANYVPLSKIGTVSIRLAHGVGPFNLKACGAVGDDD